MGDSTNDALNELVAQFLMITSVEDASKALQMLEATGNDLQAAVELYFAAGQGDDVGGLGIPAEEEEVRAPIPTKVDRLYGDDVGFVESDRSRRRIQDSSVHQPIMEAFRSRMGGRGEESQREALPSMFEPPKGILYSSGDFQDAAVEAQSERKWLILNIQSPSNFDSHRLNRDTWRDATLQALLQASFIVYQTYDVAEEGMELMGMYGVIELPTIVIVDPVTGTPMKRWSGFVDASRLAEDLVPFMDTPFDDPRAATLAASSFRKRIGESARDIESLPGPPGAEEVPSATEAEPQPEEEEVPRQDKGGMLDEERAAQAQEEARSALPPENESSTCRVAIRLPEGTRIQRKFSKDCPVSMLGTWCVSESLDAAAGKEFFLAHTVPGTQKINLEEEKTIKDAGVADCMLQMRWKTEI
jgi:UBX domain-containing protein 7